uniref:GG22244 n=1 Tax=Drosophila erecta TaxID=7220 RepID=B3P3D9_DROER
MDPALDLLEDPVEWAKFQLPNLVLMVVLLVVLLQAQSSWLKDQIFRQLRSRLLWVCITLECFHLELLSLVLPVAAQLLLRLNVLPPVMDPALDLLEDPVEWAKFQLPNLVLMVVFLVVLLQAQSSWLKDQIFRQLRSRLLWVCITLEWFHLELLSLVLPVAAQLRLRLSVLPPVMDPALDLLEDPVEWAKFQLPNLVLMVVLLVVLLQALKVAQLEVELPQEMYTATTTRNHIRYT